MNYDLSHCTESATKIAQPFEMLNNIQNASGCAALGSVIGLVASRVFGLDHTLPTIVFAVSLPIWAVTCASARPINEYKTERALAAHGKERLVTQMAEDLAGLKEELENELKNDSDQSKLISERMVEAFHDLNVDQVIGSGDHTAIANDDIYKFAEALSIFDQQPTSFSDDPDLDFV